MKLRLLSLVLAAIFCPAVWAEAPNYERKEDVIYGRKHGVALTLDVFTPKEKTNGAAVVAVISGGWHSSHDEIAGALKSSFGSEFLKRGYTVFAVVHGSQPKYTIPEAIADVQRSVRFIRYNAKNYQIDPDRIGITGGSAGCHLALMIGATGDDGNPKASDPVERVSSRVQAVGGFFPPTDFFNYGTAGRSAEPLIRVGPFGPPSTSASATALPTTGCRWPRKNARKF